MRTRSRAAADDAERPRGGSASPGPGRSLAHLDADVLGVVASFGYLNELLLLRGTCRVCRDAAQRAMKGSCRRRGARYEKPVGEWYELRVDDGPHAISTRTRVLGHCVGGLSIEAAVSSLCLKKLDLVWFGNMTSPIGDIILSSRSAASLTDFTLHTFCSPGIVTATDMLRLVRGCPNLANFTWSEEDVRPLEASSTTALTALLRSRGGRPWIYPKEGGSLADDGSGIIYATAVRH